ncbi:helix-turn-helix domain-containing protein [Chitinimonas sp.]|uniref:helix-turn-helix domain-containing protein n=1 Tax=Chitinimonas sp. TaxID=1934313 RepID=UPI0035B16D85
MIAQTMGIQDAASYLRIHANSVLKLAQTGELRGAKIGKEWVFLASDVERYLGAQVEKQTSDRRGATMPPPQAEDRPRAVSRGRRRKHIL